MQKEEIELKIAEKTDSERISQLVNSVYRGENSKKGWTTEAEFLSGIRITDEKISEIIESKNDVIILAVFDRNIIGCVHLENAGTFSYLGMLSVDVDIQAKGIGKLLIAECERYTKEVFGLSEIRMKVISRRTELIEYYVRRGYSATGELEEFGAGGDTFGDTKEKLFFEILLKKL
ncbi:MAG: GNAT family N-acetyltransferase [Ignavibacteria bacterium]|nr:GNAT family N-acetyltransferase [Ignavibacteria bacterium]MCC7158338.1 GNAT family N-acetyltransferase [Ignavibacteria bacterium]